MASPTKLEVGKRLLRDLGVMSLQPTVPGGQIVPIERGDVEDVAMVMSAGLQELWKHAPSDIKQKTGSLYLHAPVSVTLTATEGSTTVSAFTTWASWMEGCTIRIDGDDQDNEIESATSLGRHYIGTSGSAKSATVYADCAVLDETVQQVMEPLFVAGPSGYWPLTMTNSHEQFARLANFPMVADGLGRAVSFSSAFYLFTRKATANRPVVWIQDGQYDSAIAYVKRRVRFAPMPDQKNVVGCLFLMNPPRVIPDDLVEGNTDLLPIVDGAVESIYLPLCRQMLTGLSTFKSEGAKPEIARAYKAAKNHLINSQGSIGDVWARYPFSS